MTRDDRPTTRPLPAKLGVAHEARVAVLGVNEPGFIQLLLSVTGDLTFNAARPARTSSSWRPTRSVSSSA